MTWALHMRHSRRNRRSKHHAEVVPASPDTFDFCAGGAYIAPFAMCAIKANRHYDSSWARRRGNPKTTTRKNTRRGYLPASLRVNSTKNPRIRTDVILSPSADGRRIPVLCEETAETLLPQGGIRVTAWDPSRTSTSPSADELRLFAFQYQQPQSLCGAQHRPTCYIFTSLI